MKKFVSIISLILTAIFLFSCNTTPPISDVSTDEQTTEESESLTSENSSENTTEATEESTKAPNVPDKPSKKSIKILAVGNSFSVDAMEHLALILKGEGYESIVLGNLYIGGCSLDTHAANILTGEAAYDFYTNTGVSWSSAKRSIADGIAYADWDIITLQQVSGSSGVPSSYTKLQGIIDYVKTSATNPAVKIYWHMTWAYQNGSSHSSFKNYGNDQATMYKAIVSTVTSNIFTNADISGIIPSGTAIQNLVHANQMGFSGGVQLGVKYGARSVDHLESTGPDEFNALKGSDTIATILPGATFFLNMQYAPARQLIDYGIPVAMASNYNPGSCPSGNLQFQMALACIAMKLTPAEALNACTINGAFAMDIDDILGDITVGKQANIILTKEIPSIDFIPYAFTTPFIERLYIAGEEM